MWVKRDDLAPKMRPASKINWIVLSLISLFCVYLILSHQIYLGSTSTNGSFLLQTTDDLLNRVENKANYMKREVSLWRTLGNETVSNAKRDSILDLEKWIDEFANTGFLTTAKPKRILVFDGFQNYYGTEGKVKCPFMKKSSLLQQKCIIKEDKLLDITNYGGYDAYVSVRNWRPVVYDQRISSVKHVYYIEESPYVTKYADLSLNNPILASYWRGSDIFLPYGYFSKYKNQTNRKSKMLRNYAKGKTKLAAIIVSNCEAKNDRLRYVEQLQKYIPVHVYGACGPYKCDNCLDVVRKQYKFYLSFEKANCRDYISEKMWNNALKHDTVPVVMGAHPDDYKALAPPNSYVHIEDFESPKDLANYLTLLDNNDTLYNNYFAYKQFGEITNIWEQFFCRLCAMLFYSDFEEPPTWPEGSTWSSVNYCLPLNKWYWNRD